MLCHPSRERAFSITVHSIRYSMQKSPPSLARPDMHLLAVETCGPRNASLEIVDVQFRHGGCYALDPTCLEASLSQKHVPERGFRDFKFEGPAAEGLANGHARMAGFAAGLKPWL